MPAVPLVRVASFWIAIAIALFASHGCVYVYARAQCATTAATAELRSVEAAAAVDVAAARKDAAIDVAVITRTVRHEAAAESRFREIRKEVPRAAATPRPDADVPADCPACVCGLAADARRLWNDALAATVPDAAGRAAAPAARPDPAEAEPDAGAITSTEDVLRNHVDNAEVHAHNRRQCEGLLVWHYLQQEQSP